MFLYRNRSVPQPELLEALFEYLFGEMIQIRFEIVSGQPKILYRPRPKANIGIIARLRMEEFEMKEYEIVYDTGTCRKLVAKINRMAKEGWQAKSIGGLGAPTGISAVYVLMEREVT